MSKQCVVPGHQPNDCPHSGCHTQDHTSPSPVVWSRDEGLTLYHTLVSIVFLVHPIIHLLLDIISTIFPVSNASLKHLSYFLNRLNWKPHCRLRPHKVHHHILLWASSYASSLPLRSSLSWFSRTKQDVILRVPITLIAGFLSRLSLVHHTKPFHNTPHRGPFHTSSPQDAQYLGFKDYACGTQGHCVLQTPCHTRCVRHP